MSDEYTVSSTVADAALTDQARLYKTELLAELFGARAFEANAAPETSALEVLQPGNNVVGVGFGAKATVGAGVYGDLAVRVYVRSKLPKMALSEREMVPSEVNGMPTDVIAVGDIEALARPTPCGVSVGHYAITAGTLGCLVALQDAARDVAQDSDPLILSNNHVLANANAAALGDAILEPGPLDGGDPADPIATLTDFEPIDFVGANIMDAAVAKLFRPGDVTPDILGGIGRVAQPPVTAALYQSVRKHGRTTLHTVGVVMDLSADIRVRFGTRVASFEDQLAVIGSGGVFSSGGDSGSLVVDAVTRRPVGLLFAGGGGTTFVNPIGPVLERFGVAIL